MMAEKHAGVKNLTPATVSEGGAMMAEKLYTSKQVAEILQVHHRTVLVWLRNGKLHGVKMGRLWRIPESELNRIFEVYNQKKS